MRKNKRNNNGQARKDTNNQERRKRNVRKDQDNPVKGKDVPDQSGGKSLPGNNDVAWYALDPTILKDAASYPFSNPVGSAYQSRPGMNGAPGLMLIEFEPSYGVSAGASSPINLAAMKFYAFIRQANSGSKNYESSDLMMYFMAVTNLFAALAHFKRCYGLISTFSNYNKYLGKNLINALNMDYTRLRANQADLRRIYNTLVDQINMALHIPASFKISERHVFCNSGVFVDCPGSKFQMYAMLQKHYFKFDPTTYATGSALIGDYPTANGETFGGAKTVDPYDYLSWIDGLIAQLVANEDINIMSGDILKAYGDSGCYKLAYLEEQYVTPLTYDVMMLSQIHNIQSNFDFSAMKYWATNVNKTGGDLEEYTTIPTVVQKGNVIMHRPYVATKYPAGDIAAELIDLLLDIPVESPTPADVMESTRLMMYADPNDVIAGPNDTSGSPVELWGIVSGSEIVSGFKVMVMSYNSSTKVYEANWSSEIHSNWTSKQAAAGYEAFVTGWVVTVSPFDWHPLYIVVDSTQSTVDAYIGDISNFTLLTQVNITSLHTAAIYGEFDIPTKSV